MKWRERFAAEQWEKAAERPHQVLMGFARFCTGWQVRFTPVTSDWVLWVFTFADADKIRSMFCRFGTRRMAEDVAAFEDAIPHGTGAVELRLGVEQYAALRKRKTWDEGLRVERGVAPDHELSTCLRTLAKPADVRRCLISQKLG